jgi:hypothetical protein
MYHLFRNVKGAFQQIIDCGGGAFSTADAMVGDGAHWLERYRAA